MGGSVVRPLDPLRLAPPQSLRHTYRRRPDAVLEASLIHYLTIVADYRAAPFPKPSMRNADNALIMATLLQERLDLTAGRAPQRYLRSRRKLLRRACHMAKTSTPR